MAALAVRLSETASTWGRAVAPVAEWVAQAFSSSQPRSADRKHSVPTPLTQRRRSEGRGKKYTARANPVPRQAKICEVCGAEGVQNRNCSSCAVEVSRENMAQVALIRHAKPRTPRVNARISKTLSDHAVANSWWSPSSLPAWLNEECYFQRVQPRLRTVKVRGNLGDYASFETLCRSRSRGTKPTTPEALAGAGVTDWSLGGRTMSVMGMLCQPRN